MASRLKALERHLVSGAGPPLTSDPNFRRGSVEVAPPPPGEDQHYNVVLTAAAVTFVAELVRRFDAEVEQLHRRRLLRKLQLDEKDALPSFLTETLGIREGDWTVNPVPPRLVNRQVDLGDVSPANTEHFVAALHSRAQGIQTDFDDGHCPMWRAQLRGLSNVCQAVAGKLPGAPPIQNAPILMMRPRAWNMVEHNILVDGKETPGPLVDFGVLMFHCAHRLYDCGSGPFFYLSKIESHLEARLWNEIFVWTQQKLRLPQGTIKACVLIENVLASFEMHEILYELCEHSLGLNCGMWDYSASFVSKFGHRKDFVLPDRKKYVSMDRRFLKSYMDLVVQTCHRRGCHATGGMAASVLPPISQPKERDAIIVQVCQVKLSEIRAGVDGFMVYDLNLLQPVQRLFQEHTVGPNQFDVHRAEVVVRRDDLLCMPSGGVTLVGLQHNIAVGVLFVEAWLRGKGTFLFKGAVEDSATAEISRSQVWQWVRHGTCLEDDGRMITRVLITGLTQQFVELAVQRSPQANVKVVNEERLRLAAHLFLEIVLHRTFPNFITTYLNLDSAFRQSKWH